jgi:hypothetical protein
LDATSFLAVANEGSFGIEKRLLKWSSLGDILLWKDHLEVSFSSELEASHISSLVFVFVRTPRCVNMPRMRYVDADWVDPIIR